MLSPHQVEDLRAVAQAHVGLAGEYFTSEAIFQ